MATITWPQLIALMCFGDGAEDSVSGEVRVRSVDPLEPDVSLADLDEHYVAGATVIEHPYTGRALVHEFGYRVMRRGELARRESLSGEVQEIEGTDTHWVRFAGDTQFTALPRHTHHFAPIGGLDVGGPRPSLSRWEGTDFTTPTGPVEATRFLGRPAWAFELAPPSHKPYPLQMVVDAATGLVLRQGNAGFGSFAEWTSLKVGADLPHELFVWDGPTKAPEDHEARHEQDLADGVTWLAAHGVRPPVLDQPAELMLHERDDADGSFHASLMVNVYGSLMRRPVSPEPWHDVESARFTHAYRWTDGPWEWLFATETPFSDEQLADLRRQLHDHQLDGR